MSFTLPTGIWYTKQDKITLPGNILKTELIIQEEIYGKENSELCPRITGIDKLGGIIMSDDKTSMYYKTKYIKRVYDNKDDSPLISEIIMN